MKYLKIKYRLLVYLINWSFSELFYLFFYVPPTLDLKKNPVNQLIKKTGLICAVDWFTMSFCQKISQFMFVNQIKCINEKIKPLLLSLVRGFSAHLSGQNLGPFPNRKKPLISQYHVPFPNLRKVFFLL